MLLLIAHASLLLTTQVYMYIHIHEHYQLGLTTQSFYTPLLSQQCVAVGSHTIAEVRVSVIINTLSLSLPQYISAPSTIQLFGDSGPSLL